ncbi:hypothetical protein HK100_006097 [Physocladia obscura]|uniref:Non-specific serine/threonine protein kinase n=1 Tax=Physocladia obscura TaxID=109957 RepID=A0AAD5XG93_9FUNG|nr:hypothetical protein HK100_006097 [Physocladia obscura]
MIRDEYEEWVDVWVTINSTELKFLLSSLDATTYIIPITQATVQYRTSRSLLDVGNIRNAFVVADIGGSSGLTSYILAAKNFSEMEEWVERIKEFTKSFQPVASDGVIGATESINNGEVSPFHVSRILEDSDKQIFICKQKNSKELLSAAMYTVKVVSGKKMLKNGGGRENTEFKILQSIRQAFVSKLHAVFETVNQKGTVYMIFEYFDGGQELYSQLQNFGKFTEERARFYGAEIVLCLEYLHTQRIVYRDLKLENISLSREGHVVFSEFGSSRMEQTTDAGQVVGSLEYLAPEVIHGQGTSYASDWWAFGVVLYEMLCGSHPFYDESRTQMEENISTGGTTVPGIGTSTGMVKYPKYLSANAKSILMGLLVREASGRLGVNGGEEIMRHTFFSKIDFARLASGEVEAPFKPEEADFEIPEEMNYNENSVCGNVGGFGDSGGGGSAGGADGELFFP